MEVRVMTKSPHPSQADVLFAFSTEATPSGDTLTDYARRYPQYAEALAELAVELMLAPERDELPGATDSPAVDHAWQAFVAASTPLETKSVGTAGSLIAALSPADFRSLAKRLDVNTLFLAQLRDRLIELGTIPWRFLETLASELSTTVAALTEDLGRPPMVAAGERFKSDRKPAVAAAVPFETAVSNSGLNPGQQQRLLEYRN